MAWAAPPTFTSGNVLTAAQLNVLSADLNETAAAKATAGGQIFVSTGANALAARQPAGASVLTNETTASATFANLTTIGPSVTVTTGPAALVMVSSDSSSNTAGAFAQTGYDITGSSGIPASFDRALALRSPLANYGNHSSFVMYQTSLIAGSSTFKMMYAATSGGTAAFQYRQISVIPL